MTTYSSFKYCSQTSKFLSQLPTTFPSKFFVCLSFELSSISCPSRGRTSATFNFLSEIQHRKRVTVALWHSEVLYLRRLVYVFCQVSVAAIILQVAMFCFCMKELQFKFICWCANLWRARHILNQAAVLLVRVDIWKRVFFDQTLSLAGFCGCTTKSNWHFSL